MRVAYKVALTVAFAFLLIAAPISKAASPVPAITIMRVPDGGVQPQVMVDQKGSVHLIYLRGDPQHSDIFYTHSDNGGRSFSAPLRVNSQAGSAIAVGTVRGAHLAIGRGWVHVAWMGSDRAEPKAPQNASPMLY